jgi:hypothetical protein
LPTVFSTVTCCTGLLPRSSRLYYRGLCTYTMTFAQRRNRLTTHFSERIPVVKRLMTKSTAGRVCEATGNVSGATYITRLSNWAKGVLRLQFHLPLKCFICTVIYWFVCLSLIERPGFPETSPIRYPEMSKTNC